MKRKLDYENEGYELEHVENGIKNRKVKGVREKKIPWTPDHLPSLHFLGGWFGVCGSGKTNSAILLLQEYIKYKCVNLAYYIGPSYYSNATAHVINWERIHTDENTAVEALESIIDDLKKRNEDYINEREYQKAYKAWCKAFRSKTDVLSTDPYEDTKWKYMLDRRGHYPPDQSKLMWPKPFIVIDDMTHTEMMVNSIKNKLSHISLHHRHVGSIEDEEEESVGCTIALLLQTFKSSMPKVVRTNLGVILLFPTTNMDELRDIHAEVANNVTFDTFKKLFFEATKDKHDFLLIEKNPKDHRKQFGWGFDHKFIINPVEERRKLLLSKNESKRNRRNVQEWDDV